MSSPARDIVEASSTVDVVSNGDMETVEDEAVVSSSDNARPRKRPISSTVIEISDTESDDSDVCAVTTYTATPDEVKRIRGADQSSSSSWSTSSSSYSSDSEFEDDSVLVDFGGKVELGPGALLLRAARTDDPIINPSYKTKELKDRVALHWKDGRELNSEEVNLISSPFKVILLNHFLENSEFIHNMIDDMNTLDWTRKKLDLYEFHQTVDLSNLTWQRSIRGIYDLLKNELMPWVAEVTGLELVSVSASCSLYGPGDRLLPHDDLLADRRVAFILYLAPWTPPPPRPDSLPPDNIKTYGAQSGRGWLPHMGGPLQLMSVDIDGAPCKPVAQVFPANNMMALFQVGATTYHQVAEVTSMELPRLSINGWFHGPTPEDEASSTTPATNPITLITPHKEYTNLDWWVTAGYLSPRTHNTISRQMEAESEASLRAFLTPTAQHDLLAALARVPWEPLLGAHRGRAEQAPPEWLQPDEEGSPGGPSEGAGLVRDLIRMLQGKAWLKLMNDLTQLDCVKLTEPAVQRWRAGDYSLLPPQERYQEPRLDVVLYLGVGERVLCGGHTLFVVPEQEASTGALLTVPARDNALALVYCDRGTACFTQYVSRLGLPADHRFYVISCSYYED